MKIELQEALQSKGHPTTGKAVNLKQGSSDSLEELKDQYKADGIDTSELHLSDNGLPSFIINAPVTLTGQLPTTSAIIVDNLINFQKARNMARSIGDEMYKFL